LDAQNWTRNGRARSGRTGLLDGPGSDGPSIGPSGEPLPLRPETIPRLERGTRWDGPEPGFSARTAPPSFAPMPMSRPSSRPPVRVAGAPPSLPRAGTLLAAPATPCPGSGSAGPGPLFSAPLVAQSPAPAAPASARAPGPAALSVGSATPAPTAAGAVEVGLLLRRMSGVKRLLVIGAHPDDEDTALLAEMDRRRGVRAAYLSLTRGEGGQNLIGPELGKELGLLRTGELRAARRLDGAEQFFTRAYDFGFSKTAGETFRHWPRDSLLSDVVWVTV